jgi:hypothetical protein
MSVPVALADVRPVPGPKVAATLIGDANGLGGLQPSGCSRRASHQRSGPSRGRCGSSSSMRHRREKPPVRVNHRVCVTPSSTCARLV